MEVFTTCKLQIGLLLVFIYMSYLFIRDGNKLNRLTKTIKCNHFFDWLFVLGELAIFVDGISAYTVNHLEKVHPTLNLIVHLIFFLLYQSFIFIHFMYWLSITDSMPQKIITKILCYLPITIFVLITIISIPNIKYKTGIYTNYSMEMSAYTTFISIGLYSILTLIVFLYKKDFIQKNKRTGFAMAMLAVCAIFIIQAIFHEMLISSIAIILVVVSIYLCKENPSLKYLQFYHDEMVMGFATLVEGKDGSTGGHIRRSSAYTVLIAESLRKTPKYKYLMTRDYIDNLQKAAPMHDIGKISIPDDILQKKGKLTDKEFEVMKTHPEIGASIIKKTFGHLDDGYYENMAYDIAMFHHEKWNGKGYPRHLQRTEIPLSARILSVADVFDAISADRCYRKAIPLPECFEIIKAGRDVDFDPDIVDAFLSERKMVEAIFHSCDDKTSNS